MFCTGRQDTPQEMLRGVLLYGPPDTCLLYSPAGQAQAACGPEAVQGNRRLTRRREE